MGRRQVLPLAWGVSILSIAVLALGITGTTAGFTASIDNNANTAGTGSLLMEEDETSPSTATCYSDGSNNTSAISSDSNTCSINKLGGNLNMTPGGTVQSVTVTIKNKGTEPASAFTLGSTCSASGNASPNGTDTAGFCGLLDMAIWDNTDSYCILGPSSITATTQAQCVPYLAGHASSTVNSMSTPISMFVAATSAAGPMPASTGSRQYIIQTELDPSATNGDMALTATASLTWTFTQ